jgi:hypothetical protein
MHICYAMHSGQRGGKAMHVYYAQLRERESNACLHTQWREDMDDSFLILMAKPL